MKDSIFLKKLEPILNRVGKKHNITIEEGKFIIHHFFKSMKESFEDDRLPKIRIPFGVFSPTKGKIVKIAKRIDYWYNKIGGVKKYYELRLKYLFEVYVRLSEEESNKRTWLDWYNKKRKEDRKKLREEIDFYEREKRKAKSKRQKGE